MRLLKMLLGCGLVAGLVAIGSHRNEVLAAYQQTDEQPTAVAFGGIDLDVGLTPLKTSPFLVESAPDNRDQQTGLTVHPRATIAPSMGGGSAQLVGTVMGPEGPVAGAWLVVERSSDDGLTETQLVADEVGRYQLTDILGGRYRIRAWLAGTYTMTNSQVLLLADGEARTVDLTVGPVQTEPQLALTHRGDVYVGLTGSVAVSITTESVGVDGLVDVRGVPGALIRFSPSVAVTSEVAEVATDAAGVAQFLIECHQAGPATAVIGYGLLRAVATLPNCRPILPEQTSPGPLGADQAPAPALPRDLVHQVLETEIIEAGQ